MSFPCRVILLLDLDCFYAQCERVRLGLDIHTPLALLQWDSVLAVTYPARTAFQIQRGDSWNSVYQKSNGQCLALHLPILTKEAAASATTADDNKEQESVQNAYHRMYRLPPEQQETIRNKEVGVRRYAHEGKACLERYRIASSRIVSVVVDTLARQLGKDNFVLERASIDELFLDITKYCWENETVDIKDVMNNTVHVGQPPEEDSDRLIRTALERGCVVAHDIRQAVFDALGFTMSAGISTSKSVAKLGASYGKPNGQAVILPSAISHVMNETEIRKVRNLGGKVGRQVQALLPPRATTMGDIARLLPLPVLCEKLGQETGKAVFDACRGMDEEPVKVTVGALVKSITAFKSFQKVSVTSGELSEWIALLATDVVGRVQLDAKRNNRYPKSCTIQYTCSKETRNENTGRVTRSVRMSFPRDGDVKAKLVQQAKDAVYAKEGKVLLYRIGLCAVDFQTKMANGGISSFFVKDPSSPAQHVSNGAVSTQEAEEESNAQVQQDEELARKLREQCVSNLEAVKFSSVPNETPRVVHEAVSSVAEDDRDVALAKKLQAQFDRENYILSTAEKRSAAKSKHSATTKKQRIDSFFRKA